TQNNGRLTSNLLFNVNEHMFNMFSKDMFVEFLDTLLGEICYIKVENFTQGATIGAKDSTSATSASSTTTGTTSTSTASNACLWYGETARRLLKFIAVATKFYLKHTEEAQLKSFSEHDTMVYLMLTSLISGY